jgi:hypothetical protein
MLISRSVRSCGAAGLYADAPRLASSRRRLRRIAFACSDALEIRGTVDLASGASNFQVRETLISAWRLARLYP